MKFAATITRSLQAGMQAELRDLERAVATGTRDAGRGLRTELRRQVASAGRGQRLANSWPTLEIELFGSPRFNLETNVGSISKGWRRPMA
jgi:hypothetical protein